MNPGQKNLFFKRALWSMIPLVLLMAIGSARPAFSGQARDWEEEGRKIAGRAHDPAGRSDRVGRVR